jgi:hypothetical protein
VNNTKPYKTIILTLDDNANTKIALNGKTSAIFRNVSIGPHVISIEAKKEGEEKPETSSQNIDATSDKTKTAEVIFNLP